MDAILGRDKLLIEKLAKITSQIPAAFTAIVGTPVPAVIATDYQALRRMAEKKTGLPCITVESDGTRGYDFGEMLAYSRLFRTFAAEPRTSPKASFPRRQGRVRLSLPLKSRFHKPCGRYFLYPKDSSRSP